MRTPQLKLLTIMLPKIQTPRPQIISGPEWNSTLTTPSTILTRCPHTTFPPDSDSTQIEIQVKTQYEEFERIIYQTSPTPYRPMGPIYESHPFNPSCKYCYSRRLRSLVSIGLSECLVKQALDYLRDRYCNLVKQYRGLNNTFDDDNGVTIVSLCLSFTMWVDRHCFNEEEYVSWVRNMSFEEEAGPKPAADWAVEALEKAEEVDKEENCGICLEELELNSCDGVLRKLPCNHVFHEGCIVKWLSKSCVCPLCRYELPKA